MKYQQLLLHGVLSKEAFLSSEVTIDFINFLLEYIIGKTTCIGYNNEVFPSFSDSIHGYKWKNDCFKTTYEKFLKWREKIHKVDDKELVDLCIEILGWGGVLPSNSKKVENATNLRARLSEIKKINNSNIINLIQLNEQHISSGFTKIYAVYDSSFIMYDGRVGSALCCFVKSFLQNRSETLIPLELRFGYGLGRSKKYNRNPNNGNFKFPEITRNKKEHFISNIKLNWLLKSIAEKGYPEAYCDINKKMFAIQSALFSLGKGRKIPTI